MLGCHDFCGHYEWTFHYVRRRWGRKAVEKLWAEAIGGEAQQHYTDAARQAGLEGLYRVWVQTTEDEGLDCTFTVDAQRNILRWDIRRCTSKGFLMENDLNADEDYCDHCMGWVIPLLEGVGVEIVEHEHNHRGQCWATMRMKDRRSEPLEVEADIRNDPRWEQGYLDRWRNNRRLPLVASVSDSYDSCEVLAAWLAGTDRVTVLGGDVGDTVGGTIPPGQPVLTTDVAYTASGRFEGEPLGMLIGQGEADPAAVAARFKATPPERRPMLLHAYLPGLPTPRFPALGLPRPVPILPLLIRKGLYTHRPGGPYPGCEELLVLLAVALGKPPDVVGIELPAALREILDGAG